jgi:hypothetical protein
MQVILLRHAGTDSMPALQADLAEASSGNQPFLHGSPALVLGRMASARTPSFSSRGPQKLHISLDRYRKGFTNAAHSPVRRVLSNLIGQPILREPFCRDRVWHSNMLAQFLFSR